MNKKKLVLAIAASATAVGIAVGTGPAAFAAIDFSTATWLVGGVNYVFESNGTDTYGGLYRPNTPTMQKSALTYEEFQADDSGDFSGFDYAYCLGATATETTEANGDVVITCEPYQLSQDSNVWATNSYRFYNDQKLTRHIMTLENRNTSSFEIGANQAEWYYSLRAYDKTASSSNPATCGSMVAGDHWVLTTDASDTVIAGIAWQSAGASEFTAEGSDCESDYVDAYVTKTNMAAGEMRTYMTLISTFEPAGTTTGDTETAFAGALAEMSSFDSLNDTFCRGIDGLVIDGWGTCPSSLPDTGVSAASAIALGSAGAGLLAAGVITLVAIRRRQARS